MWLRLAILLSALTTLMLLSTAGIPAIAGTTPQKGLQPPDLDLPVDFQCGVLDVATSIAPSAVTFLCLEDYSPWVAMVVEAGTPQGFDSISLTFDGTTLRIEVTDDSPRSVTILINKAFADAHLDASEQNLDIRTSDAVNYQGLQASVSGTPAGVGGPFYVFVITSFSTQWIEISTKLPIALIAVIVVVAVAVILAGVFVMRRRR